MVEFEAWPDLKLFLVRYRGKVSKEETEQGIPRAERCLTDMPADFHLVADMTGLTQMEVACAPFIERVMDLCQQHGVAEIIRIIPNPTLDIGMQIMSLFHYGSGVKIFTCATHDEALKLLENSGELDVEGIRAALA